MEIQCPGCQKRLSIPDQFAGQLVKCPLCAGMFPAPALPKPVLAASPVVAPPVAAPPPPPAPTIPLAPLAPPPLAPPPLAPPPLAPPAFEAVGPPASLEPPIPFANHPLPPSLAGAYVPPIPEPPPVAKREEPIEIAEPEVVGEHAKRCTLTLRPESLQWVGPIALALVFVLSLFTWIGVGLGDGISLNLWELAFGGTARRAAGLYIFYILFVIFTALPAAWAKLALEKRWAPTPRFLAPLWGWRAVLVGGVLAFSFLFVAIDYLRLLFAPLNPTCLAMKFAVRLHLLAIVAYGLEFWLERRKKQALPPPEITARW